MVDEPYVLDDKKMAYEEGKSGKSRAEHAISLVAAECETLAENMLNDMQAVKNAMKKLDEIALKPRVFTNSEYFTQLIKQEEDNKNKGWELRVKGLQAAKKRADGIRQFSQTDNVVDLFPKYKEEIRELTSKSATKKKDNC